MPVLELATMTWEEVGQLEPGFVAVLPVGAIEAHGPHLPLNTDVVIAEAMARRGAERLSARGLAVVVLPTLSYTNAGFAAAFPGTVSLSAEATGDAVRDVAGSLGRAGAGVLALANAHLDPGHLTALRSVAEGHERSSRPRVVFPDLTTRPWGGRLTAEFKSGACHAGQFETSIVLAAQPNLVRTDRMRNLAPNPASLSAAIRDGKTSFADAGGPDAYFGDPAAATAEEGRLTIEALGEILEQAVMTALSEGTQ